MIVCGLIHVMSNSINTSPGEFRGWKCRSSFLTTLHVHVSDTFALGHHSTKARMPCINKLPILVKISRFPNHLGL